MRRTRGPWRLLLAGGIACGLPLLSGCLPTTTLTSFVEVRDPAAVEVRELRPWNGSDVRIERDPGGAMTALPPDGVRRILVSRSSEGRGELTLRYLPCQPEQPPRYSFQSNDVRFSMTVDTGCGRSRPIYADIVLTM
jgi:hypothetical protein